MHAVFISGLSASVLFLEKYPSNQSQLLLQMKYLIVMSHPDYPEPSYSVKEGPLRQRKIKTTRMPSKSLPQNTSQLDLRVLISNRIPASPKFRNKRL
jgi:hypothetical protein